MKKLLICLVCGVMVVFIAGCELGKKYYCKDGDELIGGNSCRHKFTYSATPVCKSGYPYDSALRQCCYIGAYGGCYTPQEYKCDSGDILSGKTCYKEEFYDAYEK